MMDNINDVVINRYMSLKERLERVITRGNELLTSENLSAEKREAIGTRINDLYEEYNKIVAKINLYGIGSRLGGSLVQGEESIIDNSVAQKFVDITAKSIDKTKEKIANYQELKTQLSGMSDSKVKKGLDTFADKRIKSLQKKGCGIFKAQSKIVDNSAKRACKKISKAIFFQEAIVGNEAKLEDAITEKKARNEAIERFGEISRVSNVASKILKVTNLGINTRIAMLKAKSGILNGTEKVLNKFGETKDKIKDLWDRSTLKEKLGHLRNLKQGIINGWTEFKNTMRSNPVAEPAPAR